MLEEELQKKVQEELRKLQEETKEEVKEEVITYQEEKVKSILIEDIIPSPQRKKQIKADEIVRKPKEQIVKPLKSFNSLLKPFGANMPASIVHPKDEVEMIYIPSGLFVMGSDDPEDDNPKTHVYLYAYYIDKYPVTNFRYNIFLQETNYTEPESWNYSLQTADHPIIGIDWEDAKAYADWCGKRLPTEAEWEKAGRGTDERIYPWGQEWDKYKCNNWNMDDPDIVEKMLDLENDRGTTPIGSFTGGASPYGVMDMSGNIAEWCSDVYKSPLVSGKLKKGEKEKEKDLRVCKGGSWRDVLLECFHISHRRKALYYETFDDVGFRCCQTPRHL
ncbi:MAG: SUMF1/EgtB/PvdO family nonheme iron enzyme [Candidatus Eremiobacterota bacterium]